jgi:hypothetical protein
MSKPSLAPSCDESRLYRATRVAALALLPVLMAGLWYATWGGSGSKADAAPLAAILPSQGSVAMSEHHRGSTPARSPRTNVGPAATASAARARGSSQPQATKGVRAPGESRAAPRKPRPAPGSGATAPTPPPPAQRTPPPPAAPPPPPSAVAPTLPQLPKLPPLPPLPVVTPPLPVQLPKLP